MMYSGLYQHTPVVLYIYQTLTFTGSPYRDLLTDAILKLQERQEIRKIYNYWWLEHGVTGNCDSDEGGADTNSLAIANVGGMFVVLIGGLIISFIVAVMEFLYKAYQDDSKDFSGEKIYLSHTRLHKTLKHIIMLIIAKMPRLLKKGA